MGRAALLWMVMVALGQLAVAGCAAGSAPGAGASPRPSLSVPAPSGSPRATRVPATPPPATATPATPPPATAPPATAPPATAPPAAAPPAAAPSSVSPWWWLLVAVIAAGVVTAAGLIWRRHSAVSAWNGELGQTIAELRWVDGELLPGMLGARTAAEFTRAWVDGRPRLVAADQRLFGLEGGAPDQARSASVSRLRTTVAGLISAVDAEAGLASTDPDALRAARADVERTRSEFSSALSAA